LCKNIITGWNDQKWIYGDFIAPGPKNLIDPKIHLMRMGHLICKIHWIRASAFKLGLLSQQDPFNPNGAS
jgi:hypothetical protein